MAQEYAEYNIRVNSVHPGAIWTPGIEADDIKDTVQGFVQNIPMKRIGDPEEVSNMVVFLASDMSSYSTGGGGRSSPTAASSRRKAECGQQRSFGHQYPNPCGPRGSQAPAVDRWTISHANPRWAGEFVKDDSSGADAPPPAV